MFKYVWIIILVLLALLFIGYTTWCIYDEYRCYKKFCEGFVEGPITTKYMVEHVVSGFLHEHGALALMWCCIIAIFLIMLFLESISAYYSGG